MVEGYDPETYWKEKVSKEYCPALPPGWEDRDPDAPRGAFEEEYYTGMPGRFRAYVMENPVKVSVSIAMFMLTYYSFQHPELVKEIIKIPGEVLELGTPFQGGL
jgi:hypothetical protein